MKIEDLVKVLNWLKANNADKEHGIIKIPQELQDIVLFIVGENKGFKEELKNKKITKDFLYQRILINKEFSYKLPESYWWEQYKFVQNQIIYFNNIKHKEIDQAIPLTEQVSDKKKAEYHLEYLSELAEHLHSQMKTSSEWMNKLTYLLG